MKRWLAGGGVIAAALAWWCLFAAPVAVLAPQEALAVNRSSGPIYCPNARQEGTSDADSTVLATTGWFAITNSWTAGRNINLPSAAAFTDGGGNGCSLIITDEVGTWSPTHVATLVRNGTDQIAGGSTYTATTINGTLILHSNAKPSQAGNGWDVVAGTHAPYDCSAGEQVAQTENAQGATTCADPAVQLLYQNNIPIIIPSSGTIGNNGALSGLTALPAQFASAYMYFPANKIAAGVAAGFYYVVMSSTTAATIYNNTYAPGTPPSVPGSPTAFSTTGPGAYTQTTGSDIALVSVSIAANALGLNGSLQVDALTEVPSNTDTKTEKINFGGTVSAGLLSGGTAFATYTQNAAGSATTAARLRIRNAGATNVQISNGTASAGTFSVGIVQRGTVDTTAAQNLIISGNLGTATDYIVLEGAALEKLH